MTYPKRGDVYLVNFDPGLGAEIRKTRPALILQNNITNQHSPVTIVAAITSQFDSEKLYPTEVLIVASEGGLSANSVVPLNQFRSIDKARLLKRLGALKPATMQRVNRAIQVSLGLVDLH